MSSKIRAATAIAKALCRCLILAVLLGLVFSLWLQVAVAYRESAFELVAGNVIVQNQSYSTLTRQSLFHTQSAAGTDAESFAFGGTEDGGISLAQTVSDTAVAQETGFFSSTASSDVVLPVPLSRGYRGTFILDPIGVARQPVYSGLIFPQMIKMEDIAGAAEMAAEKAVPTKAVASNSTPRNTTVKNLTAFEPVINYQLNTSDPNAASNTGKIESRQESPRNRTNGANIVIKPHDPLGHQQNKPFTQSMAAASGPLKASRDLVENLTSWDRFMMNTIGRSTTDRGINGTISRPIDIRPDKIMAPILPFEYINGALRMTRPGSRLSNRQWPL